MLMLKLRVRFRFDDIRLGRVLIVVLRLEQRIHSVGSIRCLFWISVKVRLCFATERNRRLFLSLAEGHIVRNTTDFSSDVELVSRRGCR